MLPEPPAGQCYWAPEVAYDNGTFHLYFSVGGAEGEGHQVRVATSHSPLGPFEPVGGPLDPAAVFSIDASPFRWGRDGSWYLFSCRDFLEGERVGTGIVVHPLTSMTALGATEATVVVRPHAEWHVYERARHWYDRTWDWYTVEGPFVVEHGGRLWCFYSGGAWRAEHYGVTWAVADHPLGPWTPAPAAEAADVLRTAPGAVGPGHASVVLAPDGRTPYLVYHAWDEAVTGRRLCIDQLRWGPDGTPAASGPSTGQTPVPPRPRLAIVDEQLVEASMPLTEPGWELVEVNVAARGARSYGVRVDDVAVALTPADGVLHVAGRPVPLRPDFAAAAFHQLVVRADGSVRLDGTLVAEVPIGSGAVQRWVDGGGAAFAGVTVS